MPVGLTFLMLPSLSSLSWLSNFLFFFRILIFSNFLFFARAYSLKCFKLLKTKLTLICRNGNVTFFRRCSHSKKRDIWVIFSDMKKRSDQCLKLAHQTVREPAQLFISHWGKPHFLSINWIWNKMWFFAIFEVRIRIFSNSNFWIKTGFLPLCVC